MFLAPTPNLSGHLVPLADGLGGVDQTLRTMRALVNAYRTDLDFRQKAISAVFLQPERDELSEVHALFCLVRDNIRYVRDINGVETIATPDKTLESRVGDCDDKTVTLAALLESVGYPTRFVVAGYSNPGELEHVYLQCHVCGMWVDMDATESAEMGYAPPDPVILMIEEI